MKGIILFVFLSFVSTANALSVDSAKWTLPDSISLHFTIYGIFNSFHVQNDGMGHDGPDSYNRDENSYVESPAVVILRSDSAWNFIDSNESLVYYKDNSQPPFSNDVTTIRIAIDSVSHSIRSLFFQHEYTFPTGGVSKKFEIDIKGIKFNRQKLIVEDSNITRSLLSANYSSKWGLHSNDYGASYVKHIDKVTISGSLNYNLLSVASLEKSANQVTVRYYPNQIVVLVPTENKSKVLTLYSSIGTIVREIPVIDGSATIELARLVRGVYFILADRLNGKVLVQ